MRKPRLSFGQEDVSRLYVAMCDLRVMQALQRLAKLDRNPNSLCGLYGGAPRQNSLERDR
jgi:hypothetical protein